MIYAWLTARAFGLAKGWWLLIAVAAVVGGFALWLHLHTKAAVEADRNAARAEAVTRARQADEASLARTTREREAIAAENEQARQAAAESDDPLKAGLDHLRNRQR